MNAGTRRRARAAVLRCAALLHAALLLARAAAAQEAPRASEEALRARAKAHFEQGVADYDSGRYEQALFNFQEAHRLRPHPLVHVNVANCYDKLNKPLQAVFHFERFLESDAGTPQQRSEVNAALERLRKRVGRLILRVTPDGAMVTIDHGEQRRAPILEPLQLEAGDHALQVRLEGYKTLERTVRVRGGTTYELNIALEREGSGASSGAGVLRITESKDAVAEADLYGAADADADAELPATTVNASDIAPLPDDRRAAETRSDRGVLPTSVWIAGGATAALGATAIVLGVLALSADSEFEDRRADLALAATPNQRVALYSQASDAADRAQALALGTDVLLAFTAAGAALTTYLLLSNGDTEASATRVAPVLARDAAGVHVSGAL